MSNYLRTFTIIFLMLISFFVESISGKMTTMLEKMDRIILVMDKLEEQKVLEVVEEKQTVEKEQVNVESNKENLDFNSKKFKKEFPNSKPTVELRAVNYGIGDSRKIEMWWHGGGYTADPIKLENTIHAVLQRLPNIKTTDEMVSLLFETAAVETRLGTDKYSVGIKKWRNYGMGQFRLETVKDTLKWLKLVRPDVHRAVMSFYNDDYDLTWNITHNVPFTFAMMAEYYWRRVPDIYMHIATLEDRAMLWKSEYNSNFGLGTVNIYIKRYTKFMEDMRKKFEEDNKEFKFKHLYIASRDTEERV